MTTQTATEDRPKQVAVEQKIQKLQELYADAPELGKKALENGLPAFNAGFGAPAGERKRRPDRRPSRARCRS